MGDTLNRRIEAMLARMVETPECDQEPGQECEVCAETATVLLDAADAAVNMDAAEAVVHKLRGHAWPTERCSDCADEARSAVDAALGRQSNE